MMRFTRLILALLSILLAGSVAHAQLIQTNGPYDGGINDMALGSNNRIWIATNLGLYYSDDTLQTTTKCSALDSWPFLALAVKGDSLLALVQPHVNLFEYDSVHYFRSVDNGITWQHLSLPHSTFVNSGTDKTRHRVFEQQNDTTLRILLQSTSRLVTKNFGLSWHYAPLGDSNSIRADDVVVKGKTLLQTEAKQMYPFQKVYYSNDFGNTWMLIDTDAQTSPYVYIGAVDSMLYFVKRLDTISSLLYRKNLSSGQVDTALWLGKNRVVNDRWRADYNGILLQVDSAYTYNQSQIALSNAKMLRSIDDGLSWQLISPNHPVFWHPNYTELPNSTIGFFCRSSPYSDVNLKIYSTTSDSIYHIYNTIPSTSIVKLQPSLLGLFALTQGGCLYKTTDGGQYWQLVDKTENASPTYYPTAKIQIYGDTILHCSSPFYTIRAISNSGDSLISATDIPSYLYIQLQNEIPSAIILADSSNAYNIFSRYATKDFGQTWQKVTINGNGPVKYISSIDNGQRLIMNGDLYNLDTANLQYNYWATTDLPVIGANKAYFIKHSNGRYLADLHGGDSSTYVSMDGIHYVKSLCAPLSKYEALWAHGNFFASDSIWTLNAYHYNQFSVFSVDSGKTWQVQGDTTLPLPHNHKAYLITTSVYHNGELYYGTHNASVWKKGPPAQLASGTVFYDDNNNGNHDNLEQGASFVPINKKYNTALSNAEGKFAINAPQASAMVSNYWLQQNNCTQKLLQQNQIALYRNKTICDLGLTLNPAIGSNYNLSCTINLHNYSGTAQNGMAYLQLPTNIVFDSASIKPTYISAQKLAWQNTNIQPGMSAQQIIVYGHATNSADTSTWAGTIAAARPDANPSNNSDMVSISKAAMNSKVHIACAPTPNLCLSDIAKGKSIEYTIRVNDIDIAGQSCSIQDTLSNLLDLGTLEIVALVPAGTITLNENGMLKVDFDFSNSTTKSGYIRYKIAAKQGLQEGQLIAKKVWLKTQSNDMLLSKHILRITEGNCNQQIATDISLPSGQIAFTQPSIYPNPTSGSFWIDQSKMPMQLYNRCKLVDVLGKQVLDIAIDSRRQLITVTEMPQGIYTLVLSGPDGVGNFVNKLLLNY
jgi:hypothetical protein